MSLGTRDTWGGLLDLLQWALDKRITPQDEETVREATLEWLSRHGVETFQHRERGRPIPPICFTYGATSPHAAQITVYVKHNGEPVTLIAGSSPAHAVREIPPVNDSADVHWPVQ